MEPFSIYKAAYELHHHENNIKDAIILYKNLIKNYADSIFSTYAKIQLKYMEPVLDVPEQTRTEENVNAEININPKIKELNLSAKQHLPVYADVLLTLSTFFSISAVITIVIFSGLYLKDIKKQKNINLAISKITIGNYSEGLNYLIQAQKYDPKDIEPVIMAADLYVKYKRYDLAIKNLNIFLTKNPDNKTALLYLEKIKKMEEKEKTNLSSIKKRRKF